jgi:hypothetical protein
MKIIFLLLAVTFFFIACQSSESQKNLVSNSSPEVEKIRVSENSNGDLTEAQKKKLDSRIPPKVREILDNAKEITISYYVEEKTTQLKVVLPNTLTPNAQAKVSKANVKKEFLDSFYRDSSANYNSGAACFNPRHRVNAAYKTKVVEIDICYECYNFRGKSSFGDFRGDISGEGKSSAIMDEIIKKYGAKIK